MIPPSVGWERSLLGTALSNPNTMTDAEAVLPSDLTGCHQLLWSEMVALHRRGSLGPRALIEALRSHDALDALGFEDANPKGERYIAYLAGYRGEEMKEYADQVINASTKRQLMQVAALVKAEAEDASISSEEAADNAERRIMALRRTRASDGVSMADLMVALTGRMNGRTTGNIWRPSIPEVRSVLDFAEEEDYIIVASRPGEGKSSILRYELGVAAIQNNEPCLLFNMENSAMEVARSFVAMATGISKSKIKNQRLTDTEKQDVLDATEHLQRVPLHILSMSAPSAAQVERMARYYISKHGVKKIAVDYVQLMRNNVENGVRDVTMSSLALRAIALNNGVPVIAAAQMSRAIEQRGNDPEPQLSDLRESGSLEQDGTIVMFPRHVWKNPLDQQLRMFQENIVMMDGGVEVVNNAVPIRIHVKKNRNGPVGTTRPFLFIKDTNHYRTIEEMNLA